MKYRILYLQDVGYGNSMPYCHEFGQYDTLEEAAAARVVSGDLVFQGLEIVKDKSWLFEWEKKDRMSYAHRNITKGTKITEQTRVISE